MCVCECNVQVVDPSPVFAETFFALIGRNLSFFGR